MTKAAFIAVTGISHMNSVIQLENNIRIAWVGWKSDPWIILREGETFDDVASRESEPLKAFHTREECWKYLKGFLQV